VRAFVFPLLESIDLVGSWIEAKDPKPLSESKPGLGYSAGASNIDKREILRSQPIRDRLYKWRCSTEKIHRNITPAF
jgi:hypothetical protein